MNEFSFLNQPLKHCSSIKKGVTICICIRNTYGFVLAQRTN